MTGPIDPPLTVLLAEDNPNDARLIERYVRRADTAFLPDEIELHHETNLEAALDVLDSEPIDLFLLDLGLPESSGPETYQRVKDRTENVPVIVLTGLQDEEAAIDLLQEGAQDYLNKDSLAEERLVKSIRYSLERQEREAELRTKTEQLELLNRILRHDIQNDLQVIQSWTEVASEQASAETAARLERVLKTSGHILELTENSQELVELVAGDGELDYEPVELDTILREVLDKARSKHAHAEFDCEALPAVTVRATKMLSSVFRNLINNAVQHNDSETPRVEVAVETADDSVTVTIADNGPGVPDGQKATVFGKGERGLESQGTGIGLYLVHTLVTEFGGQVGVADNEPRGAVFTVELPMETRTDGETTTGGFA